jgi:hypothetical protein
MEVPENAVEHEFSYRFGCFDLEDLLWTFSSEDAWFCRSMASNSMRLEEDADTLRNRIIEPGDADYNAWIMDAVLEPSTPAAKWIARSVDYIDFYGQSSWATPVAHNTLCSNMIAAAGQKQSVLLREAPANNDQPEGFVFYNRLSKQTPWLPHERLHGPPRLEQATGDVFKFWMVSKLLKPGNDKDDKDDDSDSTNSTDAHCCWRAWTQFVCLRPLTSIGIVSSVCKQLRRAEPHVWQQAQPSIVAIVMDAIKYIITGMHYGLQKDTTCLLALAHILKDNDLVDTRTAALTELMNVVELQWPLFYPQFAAVLTEQPAHASAAAWEQKNEKA